MVTLKNTQNRRQVFQLPHDVVCSEGECLCTAMERRSRTHDPNTGEVGELAEDVRVPSSVHLSARGTSQALPDAVVEVPAVADAIRRGLLVAD
jgi:hypothetical protein